MENVFLTVEKNIIQGFSFSRISSSQLEFTFNNEIDYLEFIENPFIYTYDNNKLLKNDSIKIKQERILFLLNRVNFNKSALIQSDYKVIKNYELLAAGLQPEYPVAELHAQRQAWRDEINELEFELAGLQ